MSDTISTGEPNTLGTWRNIALVLSGNEDSRAVKFFDGKIIQQGEDAKVIAHETQMMCLIISMLEK